MLCNEWLNRSQPVHLSWREPHHDVQMEFLFCHIRGDSGNRECMSCIATGGLQSCSASRAVLLLRTTSSASDIARGSGRLEGRSGWLAWVRPRPLITASARASPPFSGATKSCRRKAATGLGSSIAVGNLNTSGAVKMRSRRRLAEPGK